MTKKQIRMEIAITVGQLQGMQARLEQLLTTLRKGPPK